MITRIRLRGGRLLLAGLLTACSSAPVQEMSDARQALAGAAALGAERYATGAFLEAQTLLRQAETSLAGGAYASAKRQAIDARSAAVLAREQTLAQRPSRVPPAAASLPETRP